MVHVAIAAQGVALGYELSAPLGLRSNNRAPTAWTSLPLVGRSSGMTSWAAIGARDICCRLAVHVAQPPVERGEIPLAR